MDDLSLAVIVGLLTILLLTVMVARALLGDRNEHLRYYRSQVEAFRARNAALHQQIADLETSLSIQTAVNAGLQDLLQPELEQSNVGKVLQYYRP